jgi:poly(A) polymerase Pap1
MESKAIREKLKDNKPVNHPDEIDWFEIVARLGQMFPFFDSEKILNTKVRILYAYWDWCVYLIQEENLKTQMRMGI